MNNRSSIIGFALIGIILVLFSWYNTTQFEKQAVEYQRIQDSIALANPQLADSSAVAATAADAEVPAVAEEAPFYQDSTLEAAFRGEGEILTLENDKIRVSFNTKGAQPYEEIGRAHV